MKDIFDRKIQKSLGLGPITSQLCMENARVSPEKVRKSLEVSKPNFLSPKVNIEKYKYFPQAQKTRLFNLDDAPIEVGYSRLNMKEDQSMKILKKSKMRYGSSFGN